MSSEARPVSGRASGAHGATEDAPVDDHETFGDSWEGDAGMPDVAVAERTGVGPRFPVRR